MFLNEVLGDEFVDHDDIELLVQELFEIRLIAIGLDLFQELGCIEFCRVDIPFHNTDLVGGELMEIFR